MRNYMTWLVFMVFVLLVGCATIPDSFGAKVAVQQGTLRAIQEDPEKARRALEIVEKVRPSVDEDSVTVGLLVEYTRAQINWTKLTMADAQLLHMLLDYMQEELSTRIGAGILDAEQKASIERVLDWVQESAELVLLLRG
jgi:hypothetical protein